MGGKISRGPPPALEEAGAKYPPTQQPPLTHVSGGCWFYQDDEKRSTKRRCGTCGIFPTTEVAEGFLRKEVIQPQVPLRLPCYDLVPIRSFAFDADAALGAPSFRGLTGGVYKAQEHIHRGVADPRLLAIPASCGRVAAHNLN